MQTTGNFSTGIRSPSNNNRGGNAQKFTEGSLYKQVVTFQSGRGQIFNDASILKNSINSVQRRSDRQTFMRQRMDESASNNNAGSQDNNAARQNSRSKHTMHSQASGGISPNLNNITVVKPTRNAIGNNELTFGQPNANASPAIMVINKNNTASATQA